MHSNHNVYLSFVLLLVAASITDDYNAPQHKGCTLSCCLAIFTFSSGHLLSNVPSLRTYISWCVSTAWHAAEMRTCVRSCTYMRTGIDEIYLGSGPLLGQGHSTLGTEDIGTTERAWLIMSTKDCCLDQIDFT